MPDQGPYSSLDRLNDTAGWLRVSLSDVMPEIWRCLEAPAYMS